MLSRPGAFDHIRPLNGWPALQNGPLTPPIYLEDRPYLSPGAGYDISRPSSATSTFAAPTLLPQYGSYKAPGMQALQLPALSTLASVAANSVPVMTMPIAIRPDHVAPPSSASFPAAVSGEAQSRPPVCQNCSTGTTPLWRRDESGCVLCNACGLFLKLHGRARPISLKTDVIKSRNRVKTTAGTKKRASLDSAVSVSTDSNTSQSIKVPQASYDERHRSVSGPVSYSSMYDSSRFSGPGTAVHQTHEHHVLESTQISDSTNGLQTPTSPVTTTHDTAPSHAELRTRVSELEVINGLMQSRVIELEREREAHGTISASQKLMNEQTIKLGAALSRELELQKRVQDLEAALAFTSDAPRMKKARMSNDDASFDALNCCSSAAVVDVPCS